MLERIARSNLVLNERIVVFDVFVVDRNSHLSLLDQGLVDRVFLLLVANWFTIEGLADCVGGRRQKHTGSKCCRLHR